MNNPSEQTKQQAAKDRRATAHSQLSLRVASELPTIIVYTPVFIISKNPAVSGTESLGMAMINSSISAV